MGSGDTRKVYVLDSTAFYAGIRPDDSALFCTTSRVLQEILHHPLTKVTVESFIDQGYLRILDFRRKSEELVKKMALETGDDRKLSETDYSILSLALELKASGESPIIVSDDFSVQNMGRILGISTEAMMTKGIKKVIRWKIYCPGCGKRFIRKRIVSCDVCGTKLKLRPS